MRIVAGQFGSRQLEVPPSVTRPTTERTREAIFSSLAASDAVEGARVLDLFAGSGALGFEALSRGATSCKFVDQSDKAIAVIRRNAQALALGAPMVSAVKANSFGLDLTHELFDLIFVDPPYEVESGRLDELLSRLASSLAPDGLLIVERSKKSPAPQLDESFSVKEKTYGDSKIHTLSRIP